MARLDFAHPFPLQTDASFTRVGTVLTQTIESVEPGIACTSRSLSAAERNYSVTEKECLAVVWSIKNFREYLEEFRFMVVTDHSSLRWLWSLKDPTGRLARWALTLLEYDFEVQYRKGVLNVVPDFLSRLDQDLDGPEEAATMDKTEDAWYLKRLSDVQINPRAFPMWKVEKGLLYHHRANKWLDPIFPDLDSWKMVLPKEHHAAALAEYWRQLLSRSSRIHSVNETSTLTTSASRSIPRIIRL